MSMALRVLFLRFDSAQVLLSALGTLTRHGSTRLTKNQCEGVIRTIKLFTEKLIRYFLMLIVATLTRGSLNCRPSINYTWNRVSLLVNADYENRSVSPADDPMELDDDPMELENDPMEEGEVAPPPQGDRIVLSPRDPRLSDPRFAKLVSPDIQPSHEEQDKHQVRELLVPFLVIQADFR